MSKMALGVIVSNRDFFPDQLATEGRRAILQVLDALGVEAVILDAQATQGGAVETWADAQACAELFQAHRQRIAGIVVALPNFGDELGVANAIKLSGLQVPVLVQAFPDDLDQFNVERRRDAFCGKISVCNALRQYGIPFSLTELHTAAPDSAEFRADLLRFLGVCNVVNGLRHARLGAVGARPNPFITVRYSEKLLQAAGISVSTVDLAEILGLADKLRPDDTRVRERLQAICDYVQVEGVPGEALSRMARLAIVLDDWMSANGLQATALQCWSALQQNYGINACTLMSMMSERLLPSACEVDVTGAAAMYALQLASGRPSALVDWNNNYGHEPDKCALFHCSNWPQSFFAPTGGTMAYADILATTLGRERTYGTMAGRVPAGPLTFARISTDDRQGSIRSYVGQGAFTDDPLNTFGGRAVVQVPRLQELLRFICREGFEHHVAMSASSCAAILAEAFETYLGWQVYRHQALA